MSLIKSFSNIKNILIPYPKHFIIKTEIRNIARWVAPTLKELKRRRDKIGPEVQHPRSSYLDWNYDAELYAFGPRLNETFRPELLRKALTHKHSQGSERSDDNTELIRNGEKLLETCIKEYLNVTLPKLPDEARNAIKNHLTSENILSTVGKHIGLKDIILSNEHPVTESTLASTFKAVVAALYDSSGPERTAHFIKDFLITQLNGTDINELWEPSETPMETLTRHLSSQPEARLCNASAENTILAAYRVGLYDAEKNMIGIGWGETIEIATDTAARNALQRIYETDASTHLISFTNYTDLHKNV